MFRSTRILNPRILWLTYLKHPDLFILFFGWFEDLDRDEIHIAMEYIEHGHLGKYIAEYQKKVDTKEITSQILEGLVVLHEREICHRDLKPQVRLPPTCYLDTNLTTGRISLSHPSRQSG